jgi:hypothetical protein
MSKSSGQVWLSPCRVTRSRLIELVIPDTVIVEGYGVALPLSGIAMFVLLLGRTSSETIVPVAVEGEPTKYPVPDVIEKMTVSLAGSAVWSAMGLTIT